MTPKDHNLHHAFGLKNANYAAVFTIWDRLGSTLNRRQEPPWWGKDNWRAGAAQAAAKASAPVVYDDLEPAPQKSA